MTARLVLQSACVTSKPPLARGHQVLHPYVYRIASRTRGPTLRSRPYTHWRSVPYRWDCVGLFAFTMCHAERLSCRFSTCTMSRVHKSFSTSSECVAGPCISRPSRWDPRLSECCPFFISRLLRTDQEVREPQRLGDALLPTPLHYRIGFYVRPICHRS